MPAFHQDGGLHAAFRSESESWNLSFKAGNGAELLPAPYEAAARYPLQRPARPGLSVSGNGRDCGTITGRFDVLEAVYGADGLVQRFAADFEQHCEGTAAALRGSIRYNASSTFPPPPDEDSDGVLNTVYPFGDAVASGGQAASGPRRRSPAFRPAPRAMVTGSSRARDG